MLDAQNVSDGKIYSLVNQSKKGTGKTVNYILLIMFIIFMICYVCL